MADVMADTDIPNWSDAAPYDTAPLSSSRNPFKTSNRLSSVSAEGLVPLKVLRIAAHGSTPLAHAGSACLVDQQGLVAQRYDLRPGSAVLLRPDQHVCARWRKPSADKLRAALRTALARP